MTVAIDAHGLGKQYRLAPRQAYGTVRESLSRAAAAPLSWLRRPSAHAAAVEPPELIWALRDVSFAIPAGEVVGVVGRNGSGKSTLLKILSRITEPTTGHAVVRGRVGSLLEVGTGFHPELTGRENVFLNGAILGMRRAEIARKFDEIVAFAEVEQFIDTPVKHYSSGMQMRLAFAVAAHLEPEILLVDEVLAVGDLEFQKKCLGKIDDVSHDGRTVLFVSHQMNQLRRLCGRCLWLDRGRVVDFGETRDILTRYEASVMALDAAGPEAAGTRGVSFVGWTIGATGRSNYVLDHFGPETVRFFLRVGRPIVNGHHGVALFDRDGRVMWGTGTDNLRLGPGLYEIAYVLTLPLRPGPYRWQVSVFDQGQFIEGGDLIPELGIVTPPLGHQLDEYAGMLNLPYSIHIRRLDEADRSARGTEVFARIAAGDQ